MIYNAYIEKKMPLNKIDTLNLNPEWHLIHDNLSNVINTNIPQHNNQITIDYYAENIFDDIENKKYILLFHDEYNGDEESHCQLERVLSFYTKNQILAIITTDNLSKYFIQSKFDIEVIKVKIPSIKPKLKFNLNKWSTKKCVIFPAVRHNNIHLSTYLPLKGYMQKKTFIFNKLSAMEEFYIGSQYRDYTEKTHYGNSFLVFSRDINLFNKLLENHIVISDFSSKTNKFLLAKCILSNNPIITNKTCITEEYLGEDYPLYYDHPDEIMDMIYDIELIESGINHIKNINKMEFNVISFSDKVIEFMKGLS